MSPWSFILLISFTFSEILHSLSSATNQKKNILNSNFRKTPYLNKNEIKLCVIRQLPQKTMAANHFIFSLYLQDKAQSSFKIELGNWDDLALFILPSLWINVFYFLSAKWVWIQREKLTGIT